MITPTFSCRQEGRFVIVDIHLSMICKALEAVFDISGNLFTFYCRPYYLRLRFNEALCEESGERATYDLESNVMTVYLPKAEPETEFTRLDDPLFLTATEKQRAQMQVLAGDAAAGDGDDENEEEETEYLQTLQGVGAAAAAASPAELQPCGFADHFSGVFQHVDADVVREVVELEAPDTTPPAARRQQREAREAADFCEDAVLASFEDEDGEVARLLAYAPQPLRDLQAALHADGAVRVALAAAPSPAPRPSTLDDAFEEEGEALPTRAERVTIWQGNVAQFSRPLIEEIDESPAGAEPSAAAPVSPASAASAPQPQPGAPAAPSTAAGGLPIPRVRPTLQFTREENDVLLRLQLPALLFPPSVERAAALTVDLLLAEAYDDIVTEGAGCSESVWNLCALSPALAFLDAPDSVYAALVAFARRVLVYPLHRHLALVRRAAATVGARLVLGARHVVRGLLRARLILAHAEHKHLLTKIFLDPLIAFWMAKAADGSADEALTRAALELHAHLTRTAPQPAPRPAPKASLLVLPDPSEPLTYQPLTVLSLGLPFSDD